MSPFADDAAAKTGVSKRTVQANAERGEKVTPAALAMVKGTSLHEPYAWTSAAD